MVLFFVFFFKQKTAYDMRISDWSSDVCSSDLTALAAPKPSFFEAAIWIVAPVEGLRPSRAADSLTLNLPKPLTDTSSPLAAASVITAKRSEEHTSELQSLMRISYAVFCLKKKKKKTKIQKDIHTITRQNMKQTTTRNTN